MAKRARTFRDYDLGLLHIDIKTLPKLQTADGERRKRYLSRPSYTPQTNGMVERFNGWIESDVLGITIYSHNAAYDARQQRVLSGRTPSQVVAERLAARRRRHNARPAGQASPADITRAQVIVENAKDVSQRGTGDAADRYDSPASCLPTRATTTGAAVRSAAPVASNSASPGEVWTSLRGR